MKPLIKLIILKLCFYYQLPFSDQCSKNVLTKSARFLR